MDATNPITIYLSKSTSFFAPRITLADLILGRDTLLTQQPWVIREGGLKALKPWEPEPCRWLGYNAIIRSFVHEDQVLANPNTPPWRRKLATSIAGFMEGFMH